MYGIVWYGMVWYGIVFKYGIVQFVVFNHFKGIQSPITPVS